MNSDITRTIVTGPDSEALRLKRFALKSSNGEQFKASGRRATIGAHPDNDIVLQDPSVSRFHARIEVDLRGYRIIDLNSKNGTLVDNVKIQEAWLTNKNTLAFGRVPMSFELLEEEVEVALSKRNHFGKLKGNSERMREIFGLLQKIAPTDATVLIQGESGTGKELVAEAIHQASPRKNEPFVVFDCSAVSPELIESELFGHVKGAFTGANQDRKGAFEQAQGGTLFIDELGELSLDLQPKLLRALEQREIRRVGGNERIHTNVRILAATNRKLSEAVAQNEFRQDLYYRFAVIHIELPPLRDRPEDIPLLVETFIEHIQKQHGLSKLNISFQTMEKLKQYHWPGNIRELRNFIERAALLTNEGEVDAKWLPEQEPQAQRPVHNEHVEDWLMQAGVSLDIPFKDAKASLVDIFEKEYWNRQLDIHKGNLSAAARNAGVHRKTAEYLVRKLNIKNDELNDENDT